MSQKRFAIVNYSMCLKISLQLTVVRYTFEAWTEFEGKNDKKETWISGSFSDTLDI